ncbi:hypothetical protein FACS1894190_13330 [Spirochaetia bacterium]|nr:hypothetical protein FACS1894190_13330 [Spirochaetia bacterium]
MKHILFFTLILALSGCSSAPAAKNDSKQNTGFESLANIEWKLVEVRAAGNNVTLDRTTMKDEYTLNFTDSGINGRAFPNRYSAGYEAHSGARLSFKPVIGTLMMALNDPYPVKESDYLKYLQSTDSWNIINGTLCLRGLLETGSETLLFFSR